MKYEDLSRHIATYEKVNTFISVFSYLPDPDDILKRAGKTVAEYRKLLYDPHLSAVIKSRKAGILSLEWNIPDEKIKNILKPHIYTLIEQILEAPLYGYQPIEIIWEKQNELIVPSKLIAKPQEWFVFDLEGNLKLKTKDRPEGQPLPEYKFLCPVNNPTYTNPYGEKVLSKCYWPVVFKRGGFKMWAVFVEKYAQPWIIGKHPRGVSQEETQEFAKMLEEMIQDAVAVIPDDSQIEIIDTSKTSSSEIFERFKLACDMEISKAVLGQTLTTQQGDSGSYSLGQVHAEIRKEIIDADKKLVTNTINQLITYICQLNSIKDIPEIKFFEEEDLQKERAERDRILKDLGVKFTKKYFIKHYNLDEEDIEELNTLSFSEPPDYPDQLAVDRKIDQLNIQQASQHLVQKAIELINSSNSYEEVLEKLFELYPEEGYQTLMETLQKAIYIFELFGRLSAWKES